MSQSIDQAFIKQFESDVHLAYQRQGSKLRGMVRTVTGVQGNTVRFQKVGKGIATQKTRHGNVVPMNADHGYVEATLADWYAPDYVDKLDLLKTNIDERQIIINNGAYALGRQTDADIIAQLGQAQQSVGDYSTGLTKALLSAAIQKLNDGDVPDDGQRFAVLSTHAWEEFLNLSQVSSRDYVGENYPLLQGTQAYTWRGVVWTSFTGLPLNNATQRDSFLFHKTAVGQAIGAEISTDVSWIAEKVAWLLNNMMSEGACLIDSLGVVKIKTKDDSAIN